MSDQYDVIICLLYTSKNFTCYNNKKQTSKEDTNMKIKNATIKDFDTAYEYIKKLWD